MKRSPILKIGIYCFMAGVVFGLLFSGGSSSGRLQNNVERMKNENIEIIHEVTIMKMPIVIIGLAATVIFLISVWLFFGLDAM